MHKLMWKTRHVGYFWHLHKMESYRFIFPQKLIGWLLLAYNYKPFYAGAPNRGSTDVLAYPKSYVADRGGLHVECLPCTHDLYTFYELLYSCRFIEYRGVWCARPLCAKTRGLFFCFERNPVNSPVSIEITKHTTSVIFVFYSSGLQLNTTKAYTPNTLCNSNLA